MSIEFPNLSGRYDAKRHCVCFWGHDYAREITCLVDEDVLLHVDTRASGDEAGFLNVFDSNRERIFDVARKVYSKRGDAFCMLAVADFR